MEENIITVRDAVRHLNEQVKKYGKDGIYAAVVLLVGNDDDFLSEADLHRLDELRGDKLNLVHEKDWRPEDITREDARFISKGLDVYRDVLWQIHGKNIMERIAKSMAAYPDEIIPREMRENGCPEKYLQRRTT